MCLDSEANEQTRDIEVGRKELRHTIVCFKIDIGDILIKAYTKFLKEPCLTNLARAMKNERFSGGAFFPFLKVSKRFSFHKKRIVQ